MPPLYLYVAVLAVCIAGPYLLHVPPGRRRDWQLLAVGIAFATWMLAGFATLRSATIDQAVRPFVVAIDQPGTRTTQPFLLPIARYTGTDWVNTWPVPDDSDKPAPSLAQIPEAWLGGPVPLEWTRWAPEGERTRVKVVTAIREPHGCEKSIVLGIAGVSDAARDRWAPNAIRIAVNTSQPVEWVRALAPDHREALDMRAVIEREYKDAEARIGPSRRQDWTEVLEALNAAGARMQIETLVGPSSDAGPVIYYFRAVRRVTPDRRSPMAVEVHGWVRHDGTKWIAFNTARDIWRSDHQGARRPLAIFRDGSRMFWLTMLIGYEALAYAIDEVEPGSVRRLLTTGAGGC